MSINVIIWMRVQFGGKLHLQQFEKSTWLALCNFPVVMNFFPKLHSGLCDYLYYIVERLFVSLYKIITNVRNCTGSTLKLPSIDCSCLVIKN